MNALTELTFAVLLRGTWMMAGVLLVVLPLRKRAPLVASALLRGTIACLLLLPALIATLPALRVPLLSPVATQTEVAVRPHAVPAPMISTDPIQADRTSPPDHAEPLGPDTSMSIPGYEVQPRTAAVTAESRPTQFSWPLLLSGLYMLGTTILAMRLLVGLWLLRSLRQGEEVTDLEWRESLRSSRMRLGVAREVSLLTSVSISVPMTIGWMRPSILLPQDVLGSCPIDREAILLHELAHIRRHDYLWLLMQRLVEIVYWCHPLAWFIGRADKQLREQACDDVCIHWLGSSERYRDTLLMIAERVSSRPRFAIGLAMATASTLSRRVAHIEQSSGSPRCVSGHSVRLTVVGSLLIAAPALALVHLVPRTSQAVTVDDVPSDDTSADADQSTATALSGTVVGPDGTPVPGALMLIDSSHWSDLEREGQIPATNPNGEFHFPSVRRGEHELTVFSPDWALQTVSVKIPASEPLQITMHKGHRLEFRAVDTEGNPIEGIRFVPRGDFYFDYFMVHGDLSIITNSDGIAVWENAPPDALSYNSFGSGYLELPGVEYGPAGSPHTVVFERTIPVELTVVDAATGQELTEFRLYEGFNFKPNPPESWYWDIQRPLREASTVGRTLELANLDRLVQYRLQADGYLPALSPVLDAATIVDRPLQMEIRMQQYTEYSGRVLRPDGAPAAAANVHLFLGRDGQQARVVFSNGGPSEAPASQVQCDAEGRFTIDQQADPFNCLILDEAGYLQITDVELFATESVTLYPWSQVQGEAHLSGEPAPGLPLTLLVEPRVMVHGDGILPEIDFVDHGTVNASGEYLFPHCIAGRQALWVQYDDADPENIFPSNRECRSFELAAGESSIQDFGRDTVDIVGRIVVADPSANDWSRTSVALWPTSDTKRGLIQARPDESGAFRIRNVRPGPGTVYVYLWMQGEPQSEGFEVTITSEMFEGKSATVPLDLGEIRIEDSEE